MTNREKLSAEFARLIIEFQAGGPKEAWNYIADFSVANSDTIFQALVLHGDGVVMLRSSAGPGISETRLNMADILQLDHYRKPNSGNGALPVVRQYFDNGSLPIPPDVHPGDYFLAWLWKQGFKVEPL